MKMILFGNFLLSLLLLFPAPVLAAENLLPQSIGPLRLEQLKSGEDARDEINRLHGKRISFQRGYIGTYKGEHGIAKVWVSEYGTSREAAEALGRMARGMKLGKQETFWHFLETSVENVQVFFVVGMGQAHYFFQKGFKVIWLAVDPSLGQQTIGDLIKKIP